jgi:hypothetical protein
MKILSKTAARIANIRQSIHSQAIDRAMNMLEREDPPIAEIVETMYVMMLDHAAFQELFIIKHNLSAEWDEFVNDCKVDMITSIEKHNKEKAL